MSSVFRVFEAVNTKHTGGVQATVSARVGWFPHFEHLQFDDEAQQEFFVKEYGGHHSLAMVRTDRDNLRNKFNPLSVGKVSTHLNR